MATARRLLPRLFSSSRSSANRRAADAGETVLAMIGDRIRQVRMRGSGETLQRISLLASGGSGTRSLGAAESEAVFLPLVHQSLRPESRARAGLVPGNGGRGTDLVSPAGGTDQLEA
jgi:hypothetical protein